MTSAVLPAATLALSSLTYKLVWVDEQNVSIYSANVLASTMMAYLPISPPLQTISLRTLLNTCLAKPSVWLKKDVVSSSFKPQLDQVLCVRVAFLKQLFNDPTGHAVRSFLPVPITALAAHLASNPHQVFLIYGSILFPLVLRLSYKAASPNTQSALQGLVLPALSLLLTSSSILLLGSGLGVFVPAIISILYALGASVSKTSTLSVPLPAVTQAVYGGNLAVIASAILFILQFANGTETEGDKSLFEYYISRDVYNILQVVMGVFTDIFPLVVSIPLVFLGLNHVQRPKNEAQAAKYLKTEYLASEVAYGFERTWAYYRQCGMLATIGYLYGVTRLIKVNVIGGVPLSSASKYLLLVSAALTLVQLSIIITDATTTPTEPVDEEARKAIAKAPAGNPGVDDNSKALLIIALIAGPSLPAMLWYGRGEEVRGWKGRRAWRLATSEPKAIKS